MDYHSIRSNFGNEFGYDANVPSSFYLFYFADKQRGDYTHLSFVEAVEKKFNREKNPNKLQQLSVGFKVAAYAPFICVLIGAKDIASGACALLDGERGMGVRLITRGALEILHLWPLLLITDIAVTILGFIAISQRRRIEEEREAWRMQTDNSYTSQRIILDIISNQPGATLDESSIYPAVILPGGGGRVTYVSHYK